LLLHISVRQARSNTHNMVELIAKPIIKDQYWIVTDGQKKVGNIQANNAGYGVQLNGSVMLQFDSTVDVQEQTHIRFFEPLKSDKTKANIPYPQYPTPTTIYNSVFDVKRHLHLFTKAKKSKCLYAAGWFSFEQNGNKMVTFCPKFILIQRYDYAGPFKTESEAMGIC